MSPEKFPWVHSNRQVKDWSYVTLWGQGPSLVFEEGTYGYGYQGSVGKYSWVSQGTDMIAWIWYSDVGSVWVETMPQGRGNNECGYGAPGRRLIGRIWCPRGKGDMCVAMAPWVTDWVGGYGAPGGRGICVWLWRPGEQTEWVDMVPQGEGGYVCGYGALGNRLSGWIWCPRGKGDMCVAMAPWVTGEDMVSQGEGGYVCGYGALGNRLSGGIWCPRGEGDMCVAMAPWVTDWVGGYGAPGGRGVCVWLWRPG